MKDRPKLSRDLTAATFSDYYYLKEELIHFCRQEGLQSTGSKEELNMIIKHYLNTEEKLKIDKEKRVHYDVVTLDTVIPAKMSCSEINRAFFKATLR